MTPRRRAFRAWLIAAPLFVGACAVPAGGLFRSRGYVDVDLYGRYAHELLDGTIPYRDFFVEYPPGAFVAIVPPALASEEHYRSLFKLAMALVALGGLWCVALLLVRLGAGTGRLAVALGFLAASPLLLGSVWLNSYDAWPATLGVGALLALISGYIVLGFACLALAFTAKVYALALVVPATLYVASRAGSRAAVRGVAAFAGVTAAVVVPFAALAPGGVWDSISSQAQRGLHIESLGAGLLLAADRLGLYGATVSHGATEAKSRDLVGSLPDALASATSVLLLAGVVAVWLLFARGDRDERRLTAAFAACVAAVLAFTKVLSPQYGEWLLFLVPLVAGVEGVAAMILLGTALVLAELWFHRYRELYSIGALVWLVTLRDLALVGCYGALLIRLRTTIPSCSKTTRQEGSLRRLRSAEAAGSGEIRSR